MRFKGRCALLTCLVLAASLTRADESGPITLQQAGGDTLTLDAPAQSVVTLSPHLAELVFAAGAGELLAATVAYSDYPPAASDLPRVGDAFRVDVERIHLIDPDLVIGWQSGNPAEALAHLAELGFEVWALEILTPQEIADSVEAIGRATGRNATAGRAADELRKRIDRLSALYADREPLRYFYQVAAKPLYTVNGEHLISRGLRMCRGENVFADLSGLAPQVGLEAVLLANPEVLIAPGIEGQGDPLEHWAAWPRLRAVQLDNFVILPADSISRATPRFLDAVELACAMLDDLRQPGGTK